MVDLVILNARLVATMDDQRRELPGGWFGDRWAHRGVGIGEPPSASTTIDASGCRSPPGLVNTHHHLYQNLTGRIQR